MRVKTSQSITDSPKGNHQRLRDLAAELVRLEVDVIFTLNTPASKAAKNATKVIPIVFTWVANPFELVNSLARPDANITGLSTVTADLSGKRLELLKEILPGLTRLAVLWNADSPTSTRLYRDMEDASAQFSIRLQPLALRDSHALQKTLETVTHERAGALFALEDAVIASYRRPVMEWAAKHRVPTASFYREFAEAGGLLAYGAELPDLFRRAAIFVAKILKGAKPADLPVEQPRKFELVINLKAAKQLGLTIAPQVLAKADRVIK